MYTYNYFSRVYLNKNDSLVLFLSNFIYAYIAPMGQLLLFLADSGESNNGPARKCYNSLMNKLKTNFNVTFAPDEGLDDIISQSASICLKSSLEDIVNKLNEVLTLLSKFKV